MENNEGSSTGPINYLRGLFERKGSSETEQIKLALTPSAQARLRTLLDRPNPRLSEFTFIGLGTPDLIDEILVADEEYSENSGLFQGGFSGSRVDQEELRLLFTKLHQSGRTNDLMILGHMHPSGEQTIGNQRFIVTPSEALLSPSMGTRDQGGPTYGGDLRFYRSLLELNPQLHLPYAGIAAYTEHGQKLRIYKVNELIKIKRYNDIDKITQKTIDL